MNYRSHTPSQTSIHSWRTTKAGSWRYGLVALAGLVLVVAACTTGNGSPPPARPGTPEVPGGLLGPGPELYPVVYVYDGDTIQIQMDGRREKVRLQGIDTPEVGGPYVGVECFGREASQRAHSLLDGQQVRLAQDPNDDTRDRYGRLLAYVWTADGTFVNLAQVRDGFAHVYHGNRRWLYYDTFLAAQRSAEQAAVGLWSPATCDGRSDGP